VVHSLFSFLIFLSHSPNGPVLVAGAYLWIPSDDLDYISVDLGRLPEDMTTMTTLFEFRVLTEYGVFTYHQFSPYFIQKYIYNNNRYMIYVAMLEIMCTLYFLLMMDSTCAWVRLIFHQGLLAEPPSLPL
jgi:hypothetical protein